VVTATAMTCRCQPLARAWSARAAASSAHSRGRTGRSGRRGRA
jgi:hypothetical protein